MSEKLKEEEKENKLTPKQRAFITAYLGEAKYNGTEAARIAGYSVNSAPEIAFENLRKPNILAHIRERMEALEVNEFQTMAHLKDVGYSDWRHHVTIIYDHEGLEKDCKLDLRDKVKALEVLAKIQGLLSDKTEHNVTIEAKLYGNIDMDAV